MCKGMHMRMHLEIDDALVAEIDDLAGPRGRSAFVREAVRDAVDRRRREYRIRRSAGLVRDGGHEWDGDPADWVRRQRAGDPKRRVG